LWVVPVRSVTFSVGTTVDIAALIFILSGVHDEPLGAVGNDTTVKSLAGIGSVVVVGLVLGLRLLDSKKSNCRSAILERCRSVMMGACSSSMTVVEPMTVSLMNAMPVIVTVLDRRQ
jgi:hypothetical protein